MSARIVAHRSDVEERIAGLLPRIADVLAVPPRPIRLVVRPVTSCLAFTHQAWCPDSPTMVVDPECDDDVLAHEIAHCLVPSDWLLAAEGVAISAGCRIGRGVDHLLFQERTPADILRRHWRDGPLPGTLVRERTGEAGLLGEGFHRFESRLAHAVAASFVGGLIDTVPTLAASLADPRGRCRPLEATIADAAAASFEDLQARWLAELFGRHETGAS